LLPDVFHPQSLSRFCGGTSHKTEVEAHNIRPIRRGGVRVDDVCEGFPAALTKNGRRWRPSLNV
jgi:hypothetical protein